MTSIVDYFCNVFCTKIIISQNLLHPPRSLVHLKTCDEQLKYISAPNIPYGYHAQMIHGFVEELVVSDDPEYKWIDKIRTPRASNEARQTLFFKLSGEVQRKIGLKALDLGGNAVIGYESFCRSKSLNFSILSLSFQVEYIKISRFLSR